MKYFRQNIQFEIALIIELLCRQQTKSIKILFLQSTMFLFLITAYIAVCFQQKMKNTYENQQDWRRGEVTADKNCQNEFIALI